MEAPSAIGREVLGILRWCLKVGVSPGKRLFGRRDSGTEFPLDYSMVDFVSFWMTWGKCPLFSAIAG